eukprot:3460571-Rhodomonas_salina.1
MARALVSDRERVQRASPIANSNQSAASDRELIASAAVKCWQKGSLPRPKLTKSSGKPQHAGWNEAMRSLMDSGGH